MQSVMLNGRTIKEEEEDGDDLHQFGNITINEH
jgi:hypothetical protein